MSSIDSKHIDTNFQNRLQQPDVQARVLITDWLNKSRLYHPVTAFVLIMIMIGVSGVQIANDKNLPVFVPVLVCSVLAGIGVGGLIIFRIYKYLLRPLRDIQNWAHSMHGGEFFAQINQNENEHLWDLIDELNRFGKEYSALVYNVDEMVARQTESLAQKTRSLEILYDVAARLNVSRDLNEMLERSLEILMGIASARAGSIRLLTPDGKLKLVASKGLEKDVVENYRLITVDTRLMGTSLSEGEIISNTSLKNYNINLAQPLYKGKLLSMIAVPLQHHDKNLGICKLFVDSESTVKDKDTRELLTSIGQHLGLAIVKTRLDHESKRLSIMQERAMLANELHDSLAQTFASLRFQVRMLDMTLQQVGSKMALEEIEKIENGLDQANKELRDLMAHFRVRMDERGLLPALEEIIHQFEQQTGISVFFQQGCKDIDLPPDYELQILRIVQESLANIRKHSQAHTARVLLHCDDMGNYRVLIEDDGVGADEDNEKENISGHHIGQTVMQERAQRINARLTIDSEPGEGTQVMLSFKYPDTNR